MEYCCKRDDDDDDDAVDLQAYVDAAALELLLQSYHRPEDYRCVSAEPLFALLELVNYLDIPRIYNAIVTELAHRVAQNIAGPIMQRILEHHRDVSASFGCLNMS
jgi:hypothetical protein